jgi:hypothetical protein
VTRILLIHGGLWDDGMDADRFWHKPGVVSGLERRGFEVLTPNRLSRPPHWTAEADHLLATVRDRPPDAVVAGSNGCSVAVRLALARHDLVPRLLLAWPATAADPDLDVATRSGLTQLGAPEPTIDAVLAGHTVRGVNDDELARLTMPVGVLPSVPENPFHQRRTVDALLRLLPNAKELPGCPESPRSEFAPQAESFLDTVSTFATAEGMPRSGATPP